MACKITHRVNQQQIRFANRDAAERYAEIMGGGVENWVFATVPAAASAPSPPPVVTDAVRIIRMPR